MGCALNDEHTTVVLQRYLGELAEDAPPRLTRPPLNLQAEELLSAVTERLLKASARCAPLACASSSRWPTSTCDHAMAAQ
jgi:hypothetical protein